MDKILQVLWDLLNKIPPLNDQTSQGINIFVFFVQWTGIVLYALSGLFDARKHGMDIFGCLVISFVVSVGGGTVRDLLLGRYPVFWVNNPAYAITVVMVGVMGFLLIRAGRLKKTTVKLSKPYLIIDSLGLGLWAYLGTFYALQMGAQPVVAPIMGIITASFGGILRDVFFTKISLMFLPGQLYITVAAVGTIVYVILWWLSVAEPVAFLVCFGLIFVLRILSVRFNIQSRPF